MYDSYDIVRDTSVDIPFDLVDAVVVLVYEIGSAMIESVYLRSNPGDVYTVSLINESLPISRLWVRMWDVPCVMV